MNSKIEEDDEQNSGVNGVAHGDFTLLDHQMIQMLYLKLKLSEGFHA